MVAHCGASMPTQGLQFTENRCVDFLELNIVAGTLAVQNWVQQLFAQKETQHYYSPLKEIPSKTEGQVTEPQLVTYTTTYVVTITIKVVDWSALI
jgi:hypothetical protein